MKHQTDGEMQINNLEEEQRKDFLRKANLRSRKRNMRSLFNEMW